MNQPQEVPKPPLIPGSMSYDAIQSISVNFFNLLVTNDIVINTLKANTITDGHAILSQTRLTNLRPPINQTDAVNKEYVQTSRPLTVFNNGSILFNDGTYGTDPDFTFNQSIVQVPAVRSSTIQTKQTSIMETTLQALPLSAYTLSLPVNLGSFQQLLTTDPSGNLSWTSKQSPAGQAGQVQLSDGTVLTSSPNLTYNSSTLITSNLNTGHIRSPIIQSPGITIGNIRVTANPTTTYSYQFNIPPTSPGLMTIEPNGLVNWTFNGIVTTTSLFGTSDNLLIYNNNNNLSGSNLEFSDNVLKINPLVQLEKIHQNYSTVYSSSSISNIYIYSNYAYLNTTSSIKIIELSTYSLVNEIVIPNVVQVQIINNFLYILTTTIFYKYLYSSTPSTSSTSPILISSVVIGSSQLNGRRFFVNGLYTYIITKGIGITLPYNSFIIIDNSTLQIVSVNKQVPNASNLVVSNSIAYIACENPIFSLMILDCFNPKNPVFVNKLQLNSITDLAIIGNVLYTAGTTFNAIDISVLTSLRIIFNNNYLNGLIRVIALTNVIFLINSTTLYALHNSNSLNFSIISTISLPITLNSSSSACLSLGSVYNSSLYLTNSTTVIKVNLSESNFQSASVGTVLTTNTMVTNSTIIGKSLSCVDLISNCLFTNKFNYPNYITITTPSTTTANITRTITNNYINENSIIIPSINNYNNNLGFPYVIVNNVGLGFFSLVIINLDFYAIPATEFEVSYFIF